MHDDKCASFYEDRFCLLSIEDQIKLKEEYFTQQANIIMSKMTFGKTGIDKYSVEWSDFKFVKQHNMDIFAEMESHIEKLVKTHLYEQKIKERQY